jgi:hypothetical protein
MTPPSALTACKSSLNQLKTQFLSKTFLHINKPNDQVAHIRFNFETNAKVNSKTSPKLIVNY